MPTYTVEIDGKQYDIEGDREPSEQEARSAVASYKPAKLDASAFRRSDEIPSANPNPGAPGGPPARAASMAVPLSVGYAPESLMGATSIGGLVRGSLSHLFSKEGAKQLAKNIALGAGINMAAGHNPRDGIAEGILYTALGGHGAGTASKVERGAETASEFALKIPKYVAPVAKQAERVATWTPQQLGMELIEESAAKNGSSLAEIAKGAAPKLKLSAAEVKKIMDRQAIPMEQRVNDYLRKAGEPEEFLSKASKAPETAKILKMPPPKTADELVEKLRLLYGTSEATNNTIEAAAREAFPGSYKEIMKRIKQGNTRF